MGSSSIDFGVDGTAHAWYSSYFSNRSCRVLVSGVYSDDLFFPYGVPQGSVTGPLCFVYYTHKGIAGLVVWYLASGAQGPRINTRLGHSRLGYRIDLGSLQILNLIGSIYWLN